MALQLKLTAMPAKLLSIEPQRNWTERHAHHRLRIAEDQAGQLWLRLEDLRQWMPGLGPVDALHRQHPGAVRCMPPSVDAFIAADTFLRLTQKSTNTPTIKLRHWLDTSVLEPARRKKQHRVYAGGFGPRLPSEMLSAEGDEFGYADVAPSASKTSARRHLDPRFWLIARGQWGLKLTLLVGFFGAFIGAVVATYLSNQAWDVDNNYLFWTWVGLAVAAWSVGFNAAWAVGAVRSGLRRVGDIFNPWITTGLVALNLAAAALMSGVTVYGSGMLLSLWWLAYAVGDPPAEFRVTNWHANGTTKELSLSGPLGIGSTKAFREALLQHPTATDLVLASPGGFVIEGFGLADAVAMSGIQRTAVLQSCSSACTLPFLQGKQRAVAEYGTVGFHRSYSILGDYDSDWGPIEHRMADLMRERGVTERFIQRAFSTPGWDMYKAPVEELVAQGVASEIIPSAPKPEGTAGPRP